MAGRDAQRGSAAPAVLLAERSLTVFLLVFFPRGLRASTIVFGTQVGDKVLVVLAAAS